MKTYIITGAGRGIGKEVALKLSQSHKVIAISRDISALNATDKLVPVSFDLSGDLDSLMEILKENDVKEVSGLINNAGALINKPFQEITEKELAYIYKVNVFAPFLLTQRLISLLKKAEKPHVVNIGSVGGVTGSSKFPGLSAYSSSKGSLAIMTECLAEEYQNEIYFNCLALGAVQTEMLKKAFPGYEAPISPKEMAVFIADFVQAGHNYQNGKTISVSLSNP